MILLENTLQNVGKHNGVITILTGEDVATLVDGVMVIEAWRFWIPMNRTGSWLFVPSDAWA
jgi:hypothetical protein